MLLASLLLYLPSQAQQVIQYNDHIYLPNIKSVECYNTSKEGSFPLIQLRSGEQLQLAFDDLGGNSRQYYYSLEHCDAQWQPSRLSPTEYLTGFVEDRIMDYNYSSGTIQKYIHYEVKIPNQTIAPKLPGNYLLKVYEDGNQSKMIITRRVYVATSAVGVGAQVVPSNNVQLRDRDQKINFTVNYGGLNVQNPYGDIKVVVMQNGQQRTAQMNTRPTFIRNSQLIYSDPTINDFAGGNEYRLFDLRTLKLNSQRVARIFRDTANTVLLTSDEARNRSSYLFEYDNNGEFLIRNQDGRDPRTDADYANVYFNLALNSKPNGDLYVVGRFNNFELTDANRMTYDATRDRYTLSCLLKQGIYDYKYVLVNADTKKPDSTPIEGSYFETENTYQILVYYRQPGSRWDELVGYQEVRTK